MTRLTKIIWLLRGSFRPADAICVLRSYLRYRSSLVRDAHTQIHRMQKALQQMNVQLHHVLSDLTGTSGMAILRAIVAGERDPVKLAHLKHTRVPSSTETVAARWLRADWISGSLASFRPAAGGSAVKARFSTPAMSLRTRPREAVMT